MATPRHANPRSRWPCAWRRPRRTTNRCSRSSHRAHRQAAWLPTDTRPPATMGCDQAWEPPGKPKAHFNLRWGTSWASRPAMLRGWKRVFDRSMPQSVQRGDVVTSAMGFCAAQWPRDLPPLGRAPLWLTSSGSPRQQLRARISCPCPVCPPRQRLAFPLIPARLRQAEANKKCSKSMCCWHSGLQQA